MKNLSNFTTYQAGLLQAKAYRTLKAFMIKELRTHKLTMMQWAILGYIYDRAEDGVRISELAKAVDVEVSFITNMINQLENGKLVKKIVDPKDSRARKITLTNKSRLLVEMVEAQLRTNMQKWLGDINRPALLGYVLVLKKIAAKSHK